MQKNKNENTFSKREDTFLPMKRFQFKMKAEKNISCFFFFFKKKEKVHQKNTFKGKVYQKNTIFLFFLVCSFFF